MKRYNEFLLHVVLFLSAFLVVGSGSLAAAGADLPVPAVNAPQGVALKGYDPVAYFVAGQPTKGVEQHSLVWQGATYRFASEENQALFKADPDKYLPQYGGYCAYAMSLDRIADIDPSRWAIVGEKLYLNNGLIAEKLWSLNKPGHIESADRNWPRYPKQPAGK